MVVGGAPPRGLLDDAVADQDAASVENREANISKLTDLLQARADELDRREQRLGEERAEIITARKGVENDRRALEQQAMALWKANTQLESEREAISRRYHDASLAPGAAPRSSAGPGVSRQALWRMVRSD